MVKQYPYKLEIETLGESEQDENGNWVVKPSDWQYVYKCRDEAGNGRIVRSDDGENHIFTALIQCPKGTEAIKVGTKVRVIGLSDEIRVVGAIIYSRKDQLHTRLWV